MIQLHYSSRTEALLDALVQDLARRRQREPSLLEPVHLVVPNATMERYLEIGLAQALGIAANLVFHRLERFVGDWLARVLPGVRLLDSSRIESTLIDAFMDAELLARPELGPVAEYLQGAGSTPDAVDLRRVQLAGRLAHLFEEYAFSRPELLRAWRSGHTALADSELGHTEAWQRVLWDHTRPKTEPPLEPASGSSPRAPTVRWAGLDEVLALLAELDQGLEPGAPRGAAEDSPGGEQVVPWSALHVFGVSYVARAFQRIFDLLGRHTELHLYTLNPCMEFWEDAPAESELRHQLKLVDALPRRGSRVGGPRVDAEEDPFELGADDNPALRLWGRPGREHVRLLNELTECDFHACFEDPLEAGDSLLHQLQQDVLLRRPERTRAEGDATSEADDSVQILACPGVRREVESIADEIWRLVRADEGRAREVGEPPLRFNDIALIVNAADRELYLPHVQACFEEAHGIPCNIVDLPASGASAVIEAALLLLDLPLGNFSRPEVLAVLSHPALSRRFDEADESIWARLCERLGAFQGIDRADQAESYLQRDQFNFDQALRRLALGAFMTGEASGDARYFEHQNEQYLVEEPGPERTEAARFGLLIRSLAADVRAAGAGARPPAEWAAFLSQLWSGYLVAGSEPEQAALRRCLAAAQDLGRRGLSGEPVSYRIAAELVRRSLGSLRGGRGDHLADGVVVSSFQPMRAIPFRFVFVAGLGEGKFPASDRRDTMDLRHARRRAGDVSPAERDRYLFLETLLCARDRLTLSYVARDEQTGDGIAPSAVVQELLHMVEQSRGVDPAQLERRPPLRRHEEALEGERATVLREAWGEARARALGDQLRAHLQEQGRSLELAGDWAWLRRALGPRWSGLEDLLCLAPLPAAPQVASPTEVAHLSLGALRRFLECPLQGWARAVLRLEQDDEDASEQEQDEPFAPGRRDVTVALREVFERAVRREAPRARLYEDVVERMLAHGRWSAGVLRELWVLRDGPVLAAWQHHYDEIQAAAPAGQQRGPIRIRFGAGPEHHHVDEQVAPISVELELASTLVGDDEPAGPSRVELSGTSQPLIEHPRGSLLPLVRTLKGGERDRVRALRESLRAFVDHVALAATETWPTGPHSALLLYDDPALHWALPFRAVSPERARRWLAEVAADLLEGAHAYLMPCEAVLRLADRFESITGEELVASIEQVRDSWDGGQSAYGPVPHAVRQAPPDPADALRWARRRFGLFFELAQLDGADGADCPGKHRGGRKR